MQQLVATVIIIIVSILAGLYSFWTNSKKDGFDQEKVFDLVIYGFLGGSLISIFSSSLSARSLSLNLSLLDPFSFIFGFVLCFYFTAFRWKWSLFRVLDNLAISCTILTTFLLISYNLILGFKPVYIVLAILLCVVYYLLQKYRLVAIKSGFTFCLVSGLFCLAAALTTTSKLSLLFIGLLFTLTLSVLISRLRSLYGRNKENHSTSRDA